MVSRRKHHAFSRTFLPLGEDGKRMRNCLKHERQVGDSLQKYRDFSKLLYHGVRGRIQPGV